MVNSVVHPIALKLIELTGDLFIAVTPEGFIIALSKEWEPLLGRSIQDIRAYQYEHLVYPKDLPVTRAAFEAVKNGSDISQLRLRFVKSDGEPVWLQLRATKDQDTGLIYSAATVIAPLDMKQEEIEHERQKNIHTAKLASLGEIAAGVAHELNNPLSIVMGYLKMLELEYEQGTLTPPEFKKIMGGTLAATERATKIIQNLKNLARDGAQDPLERVLLDEIIESTLDFVREKFRRYNVKLEVNYQPHVWVMCRQVELSQVILNLLTNAFDACEGHTEPWIKLTVETIDKNALIQVSNSGPLISSEIQQRIFTPFFTTKKYGRGTGLGLSIAASIMHRHNGELYLKSRSEFTTFVARIPISPEGKI